MKKQSHFFFGCLLAGILLSVACRPAADTLRESAPAPAPLSVYVTHYPLQYWAETIGGERVSVQFPAPSEIDPAEWRPSDEVVLRYQQADLILLNGAGYERWMRHVSLPAAVQVETTAKVRDRLLEVPDAVTHSHGAGGHVHSHAGTAFTTWLDPLLAIEQARAVKEALAARIPDGRDKFEARFLLLAAELEVLDRELETVFALAREQPLLASHPVYHYLEARYQLNLQSLHFEPDEMPDDSQWEVLDRRLREHPARWILWEDEPLPEIAERLRERGVEGVVYNPTSQPPENGDFLSAMRHNVSNLRRAWGAPAAGAGDLVE